MMKHVKYFHGDDMAADAWMNKYAAKGERTPRDMHIRLATPLALVEDKYIKQENKFYNRPKQRLLSEYGRTRKDLSLDRIFNYMDRFKHIIPQGSIMSMLGNEKIGSLSNCFVIGQPQDSYGGIMYKDQQMAQLMKRRGGVGLDISTLAPRGRAVNNAAKTSTGAASFMERFSNTTREVAQDGRRGALMLTIDVRHPDVMEFINAKKDRTKVTGANISVMLRNDFMEAVQKDEDYILRFPCDMEVDAEPEEYNKLVEVNNGVFLKRVKAKEIYDSIVENAWENAEPGQMFVDRHWDYSPDGVYPQFRGVTTNPCGEIFMQAYDACRLLAQNFLSVVMKAFEGNSYVDYKLLYEISYELQRLADDIVDLEIEHIDRIISKINSDTEDDEVKEIELSLWKNIRRVAESSRRTGSGFTALGDMLAALGMKYDSPDAKETIARVMKTKMRAELDCTIDLAILRGPFVGWDVKKEFDVKDGVIVGKNKFFEMIALEFPNQASRMMRFGRRNVNWSTVAPTGTVSLMSQTTSGLEPLFSPYYVRRRKINPNDPETRIDFTDQNGDNWMEYPVMHQQFERWCRKNYPDADITNQEVVDNLFKESPWYGSIANDIDWVERVEIQSIIQHYTSHSISSTINLPKEATKEDVAEIYLASYNKGLKGVTIYRDGSRTGVLVTDTSTDNTFEPKDALKRPQELQAESHIVSVRGKKFNVLVGLVDDKPYEVFAFGGEHFKRGSGKLIKEKKGKYTYVSNTAHSLDIATGMTDEQAAITRLISTSLRHGTKIQFIVEQLQKTDGDITSFTKAIARVLKKYIQEDELLHRAKCDDCGSTNIRMEEGCMVCNDCGSSKCG